MLYRISGKVVAFGDVEVSWLSAFFQRHEMVGIGESFDLANYYETHLLPVESGKCDHKSDPKIFSHYRIY